LDATPKHSHIPNGFSTSTFGFRKRFGIYGGCMPRTGGAYIITDEWRRKVRAAIDALLDDNGKPLSDAKFAKRARISPAALSEALSPGSTQTTIMREIHEALGWEEPRLVIAPDTLEALAQWDALGEFARGAMLEKLRAEAAKETARREAEARRLAQNEAAPKKRN
jgi:hypothetical protein